MFWTVLYLTDLVAMEHPPEIRVKINKIRTN